MSAKFPEIKELTQQAAISWIYEMYVLNFFFAKHYWIAKCQSHIEYEK